MILPSQLLVPTTETAGYFECPPEQFADWLVEGLGPGWDWHGLEGDAVLDVLETARSQARAGWYLLMPVDGWTVLLNDTPLGTDVGVLPTRVARELGCRAVRATAGGRGVQQEGTILEVFDPAATDDPYLSRRTIYAADEDGRWQFGHTGEPFPFEDVAAYERRRVRDRFTPDLLERYLEQLGVPVNEEPDAARALVVEPG